MFTYGWNSVLIIGLKEGESVAVQDYLVAKKSRSVSRSVNVVDLMSNIKLERERERKNVILLAAATLSVLFLTVLLLSL